MIHFAYIIYSPSLGKFYVGQSISPTERLNEHNSGHYEGSFTKQSSDWELFLQIPCKNKGQAVRIEKQIKRMKSTTYIKNLKRYPEMIEKLLKL